MLDEDSSLNCSTILDGVYLKKIIPEKNISGKIIKQKKSRQTLYPTQTKKPELVPRITRSYDIRNIEQYLFEKYSLLSESQGINNKVVSINFDEEVGILLEEYSKFYQVYVCRDNNVIELDLNIQSDTLALSEKLIEIFNKGIIKKDKTYKIYKSDILISTPSYLSSSIVYLEFKDEGFIKCGKLLKTEQKFSPQIQDYVNKLLKDRNLINLIFILDTFHDIKRVKFLEEVYRKITFSDFKTDYFESIQNFYGSDLKEEGINLLYKIVSTSKRFEIQFFASLLRTLNLTSLDISSYKNKKLSLDVWLRNRDLLKNNFDIKTLYTSYFDSNPTNTSFPEDEKTSREKCEKIKFNILGQNITYNYDFKNKLEVQFKGFGKDGADIYTKTIPENIGSSSGISLKKRDFLENVYSLNNKEFTIMVEKILEKGNYDITTNTYHYSGKKSGPSINEICTIVLMMILYDKINKGLPRKEEIFKKFEEGFFIKRSGDLGQVLLSKKLDYIFATNDYIQASLALLNGNKLITTCGMPKLYQTNLTLDQVVNAICI